MRAAATYLACGRSPRRRIPALDKELLRRNEPLQQGPDSSFCTISVPSTQGYLENAVHPSPSMRHPAATVETCSSGQLKLQLSSRGQLLPPITHLAQHSVKKQSNAAENVSHLKHSGTARRQLRNFLYAVRRRNKRFFIPICLSWT